MQSGHPLTGVAARGEIIFVSTCWFRYFTGTAANLPGSRLLYWVGEQSGAQPHCLTCSNPACSFSRATLAPAATAYMLDCLGPAPPISTVVSLPANQEIFSLDTNNRLVETLQTIALPQVKYFTAISLMYIL